MAVSTRILRRRMKSVANTRKITKAMELVAGAKMRKSVQLAFASRDYSATIRHLVHEIRSYVDPTTHPLLAHRSSRIAHRTSLLAIASSDRGLCGGFNAQILKKALEHAKSRVEEVRIVTIGRRAELAVKRAGFQILGSFEAISTAPSVARALPISTFLAEEFLSGRVDRVFFASTDFQSAIAQTPTVKQLLPIIPEEELASRISDLDDRDEAIILFEPSPKAILDILLPRLLETQIYQSLLESSASEHSARMMAMRNATENASEMLQDLSFTFNQARQATITREISEISAGKAAIE